MLWFCVGLTTGVIVTAAGGFMLLCWAARED
jgi:hypothetical protein